MTLRRHSLPLLLALLVALPSVYVSAQDGAEDGVFRSPDIEMSVRAGFGKLQADVFTGGWVPFRISLANNGKAITGRLIVRTESPPNTNSRARDFVKDVQLPSSSRQLHEIPVFLNSGHRPVEIVLESDGDEIARTSLRVERDYYVNDQLEIAVIDSDPTALNNISSTEISPPQNRTVFKSVPPGSQQTAAQNQPQPTPPQPRSRRNIWGSNRQGPTAHPIVIQPEDMPRDFVSYDSLDAVVLGDAPVSLLTEEQARALKLWVASGGLLIVTGGADFAGLRTAGLDSLLPVEARGANSTPGIPELVSAYGAFESADATLIQSAVAREGARALLGTDDRLIAAERDYGSGLVRFLAINPKIHPYRGWGAAKTLWNDLLLPAVDTLPGQTQWITSGRRGNSRSSNWGIQNYLFELAEIKPPSANYFLLFLLAYILVVGPINYLALRWTKKLDLAWITIPAVVLLFTAVSVTVAQLSRGGATLAADVTFVELHQREGVSRAMSAMLIRPSSRSRQQMTFDSGDTFAIDATGTFDSRPGSSDHIEIARASKQLSLSVPMNTWTTGVFNIRSVSESSAPMISAATMGDGKNATPQVRVKNVSDSPLTSAVYLSSAGMSDPFDLAAGEEKLITLNPAQHSTFSSWFRSQLVRDSGEEQVFRELAFVLDREIGGQAVFRQGFFDHAMLTDSLKQLERPLLLGFIENNPISMSFASEPQRRSKSLCVVHL
ncbi:MAG: hypothetical protein AB1631_05820 [Acidobacteriota bacterium]